MISSKFSLRDFPHFLAKYAYLTVTRRPILVHFEVTMRCNAGCEFCDYWKTDSSEKARELKSFADAARFFNPMMITFTGGEPTLRRDLEALVRAVSEAVRIRYITLLTHGGMLTPERARGLWDAGVDQFNISLDYLDGRHDAARKIPGLTDKIFRLVPGMREKGVDNIRFNTVIKDDNLDQLIPIVERAKSLGCGVNFSTYTDFKNGNTSHLLREDQLKDLEAVIAELISYKRRHRGVITSSDYYLRQIPRYVRGEMSEPCRAGIRTIHVNPFGHVRRCPDLQSDFHWSDFRKYEPIDCNACYYACRGEAQAPLTLSRVRDLIA